MVISTTKLKYDFPAGLVVFLVALPLCLGIALASGAPLLSGIMAFSLFYLLKSNYKNPFTIEKEKLHTGETIRIELPNQVSLLNKASIKDTLWSVPENTNVIIDANYADYIDNDILEIFIAFKNVIAPEKNVKLNIIDVKEKYQLSDHVQFVNVLNRQDQERLTPQQIVGLLKKGNERFRQGKWTEKYFRHQINATSSGQFPMAVIVSCIDSRTSSEILFDSNLGDIISIRIAGNIINKEIIGSIELAVKKMGVKLILVKGHSNCGAVGAAIHSVTNGNIDSITQKIKPLLIKPVYLMFNSRWIMERLLLKK